MENIYEFKGKHTFGEMYGVDRKVLNDKQLLIKLLKDACSHGNATVMEESSVQFQPEGVTIALVLAESHATIHTYPEDGSLFFDAFTCGNTQPTEIFNYLQSKLKSTESKSFELVRGRNLTPRELSKNIKNCKKIENENISTIKGDL